MPSHPEPDDVDLDGPTISNGPRVLAGDDAPGETLKASSQRSPGSALVELRFQHGSRGGETIRVAEGETVLGRRGDCDVVLDRNVDACVSGRHARISVKSGAVVVEDLGSTNGTRVNGSSISAPRPLRSGDVIELGRLPDADLDGCVAFVVVLAGVLPGERTIRSDSHPAADASFPETILAPVPAAPRKAAASTHGLWGRVKGQFNDIVERRELRERLRGREAARGDLEARELRTATGLGRSVWEMHLPLPAGDARDGLLTLEQDEKTTAAARAKLEDGLRVIASDAASACAAVDARAARLRDVETMAQEELELAAAAAEAAKDALREKLEPGHTRLAALGRRLAVAAEEVPSDAEVFAAGCAELAAELEAAACDLAQVARAAAPEIAEAHENATTERETRAALQEATRARLAVEAKAEALRRDEQTRLSRVEAELAAEDARLAELARRARELFPALGRDILASPPGETRALPAFAEARDAAAALARHRQECDELVERLDAING